MRNNHWSFNCAVIYLILIFIINAGISIWSTIEHGRLTHDSNNSVQAATSISQGVKSLFNSLSESFEVISENKNSNEVQIKVDELQKKTKELEFTARSTFIYLCLSAFASFFTTIFLFIPKIAMDIIEKFIELPDIDYDSLTKFKYVMVLANFSILCWDLYGVVNTWKFV